MSEEISLFAHRLKWVAAMLPHSWDESRKYSTSSILRSDPGFPHDDPEYRDAISVSSAVPLDLQSERQSLRDSFIDLRREWALIRAEVSTSLAETVDDVISRSIGLLGRTSPETKDAAKSLADEIRDVASRIAAAVSMASDASLDRRPDDPVDRAGEVARNRPRWDNATCKLWFNGQIVRTLPRRAKNCIAVLQRFEDEGWPPCIDDPFLDRWNKNSSFVNNTVTTLNEGIELIRFSAGGDGRTFSWSVSDGELMEK